MRGSLQPDLFSRGREIAIDPGFKNAVRTRLDAESWIEIVPAWLSGSETLFACLVDAVPWQQRHRRLFEQLFLEPRLTAEYRCILDAPPSLVLAASALSRRYGPRYDSVWLNLYRDGRDSTGWHRDRFSCRRPDCIVPVLTLGATRRFVIKPRRGGPSVAFSPRSGDLIVMGGRCQEDWLHGVPKTPGETGGRISVNFQSSSQARRA